MKRGSFAPSKYALVMDELRASRVPMTEHRPDPMPRKWIEAVHDPDYVEEVLGLAVPPEKVRRIGFPINARTARRAMLSVGGTWRAAELALAHGYAANGAGGSHHALADTGAGYCVFNDLAVTAHRLVAEGRAERVLIVDLDVHQGDGTAALLAGRPEIFTFSMHAERNFPVRKAQSSRDIALPDGIDGEEYNRILRPELDAILDGFRPDILLYQAGVDPHHNDRLGRLALDDAGLKLRDMTVMIAARKRVIPVASTLGGGYGIDPVAVARRHAATILTLTEQHIVFTQAIPDVSSVA